jgi:hypothetical protein
VRDSERKPTRTWSSEPSNSNSSLRAEGSGVGGWVEAGKTAVTFVQENVYGLVTPSGCEN